MQIKAVLFDLFDTLLLIEGGDAFYEPCLRKLHEFLVSKGVNVSFEEFKRIYFKVLDELYAEANKNLEEPHFNIRVWRTLQVLGYNFNISDEIVTGATEAFADEFMRYVRLDKNAMNVLQRLHGKYLLGVVSNFAIPECVWKLLEKFGLKKFFDVVVVSATVNKRKPSPKIFEKALKDMKVDASQTVFVGDTPRMDIEGAKNVGMKAVLVERRPAERTTNFKPDKIIKSLEELLDVLENC
ncbi:MAG: HAD family hydrolase [Candidatus Bathyarchaeia archaeon]